MKNSLTTTLSSILICVTLTSLAQNKASEITGVYQYLLDDRVGIAIISPTHFAWMLTDKDRQTFQDDMPSMEEKSKAYLSQNAAAGTWTFTSNNRIQNTFTHHFNPKAIGNSFEYEFERVAGDLLSFWVLDAEGKRGPKLQSKKIAEWNAKGSCSTYNGVWSYEGWNGISINSGAYIIWVIHTELVPDLSTDEHKAQAFDNLNGCAVIADCSYADKHFWTIIHSSDSRREKTRASTVLLSASEKQLQLDFINQKGEAIGRPWTMNRLDK